MTGDDDTQYGRPAAAAASPPQKHTRYRWHSRTALDSSSSAVPSGRTHSLVADERPSPAAALGCHSVDASPRRQFGAQPHTVRSAASEGASGTTTLSRRQKLWRSIKQHADAALHQHQSHSERRRSRVAMNGSSTLALHVPSPSCLSRSQPDLASGGSPRVKQRRRRQLQSSGCDDNDESTLDDAAATRGRAGKGRSVAGAIKSIMRPMSRPRRRQSPTVAQTSTTNANYMGASDRKGSAQAQRGQEAASLEASREAAGSEPLVTFLLRLRLMDGRGLAIRDASGSSDPYVKFRHGEKLLYKSNTVFKNLNPVWDEAFQTHIDDITMPLIVDVFDYDRFAADDFMGAGTIDLSQFALYQPYDVRLALADPDCAETDLGYLNLQLTVQPQTATQRDDFLAERARQSGEGVTGSNSSGAGGKRGAPKIVQVWTSVVNIVLVEARNLLPTDRHNLPDPYVKFKLGAEKYKCKPGGRSLAPKWLEQFDMHVFNERDQLLELVVMDKRTGMFMGRTCIDLAPLEREITHQKWYELDDGAGQLMLLVSITGTLGADTVSDLKTHVRSDVITQQLAKQYDILHTFQRLRDVGHLSVKVYRAQGLAAADIGGKSDPFCVLELVNARLQTHTEYKTLNPEWNKIFTFAVKDVHSVLEVTVYDEDPNKKVEFLGKVAVPLLKTFILITYNFELYMLPLSLLLLFAKEYAKRAIMESSLVRGATGTINQTSLDQEDYFEDDDEEETVGVDEKDDAAAAKGKSLKDKLNMVQETLAQVQHAIDFTASLLERVKNTFTFCSPFCSWLLITVLICATILLYHVPLRWLIMAWGVNKFTKKLRAPHAIPNNEVLDFLSRVPSDPEIRTYGEFRPEPVGNAGLAPPAPASAASGKTSQAGASRNAR